MARSFDIALFGPSDGLTPIQTKKLNSNFQRLLDIASGADEGSEAVEKIIDRTQDKLMPMILDAAYPIGCLVLAKDSTYLPKWGKWREITDYDNRFIRIGGTYGTTGGSSSQTVEAVLPAHTHTYYKQVAGTKVKVDVSTSSSAKQVISTLEDEQANTGSKGDGQSQTISTIPPFVRMKLFERYE